MQTTHKKALLGASFVVIFILDLIYGPFLYSRLLHKEHEYEIGKVCALNRAQCEETYFRDDLDRIEMYRNEKREFFSNILIFENQSGYTGSCPCPYSTDSRGGSCGGRSSYSKNGKISYCYDSDISDDQIDQRRAEMIESKQRDIDRKESEARGVYAERYTMFFIILGYGLAWWHLRKK